MAAVFLVTLYEYSPLFYISVVSLCFLVTAAMVLGWFGFDVPVILRSSDEVESLLLTPEKQMVQVRNPFALEMRSGPASVTGGVCVRPRCLEPCVLSCFWGCEVRALQGALQAHQHGFTLSTPQRLQQALNLQYFHCQSFQIGSEDTEERRSQIPASCGVSDLGPLPRGRYPVVAVLTLAEAAARETYNIVCSVTVIHVPDDKHGLSARILFQYLLTSQGHMYELKPLFMSADGEDELGPQDSGLSAEPRPDNREDGAGEEGPDGHGDWTAGRARDCVVCQNAAVNRVLLPCRHACVCDGCVSHFQHCPMCRAFVLESFTLSAAARATS
ncbi:cell growth regulator with RING finger domain protein 1 isoform X2 [Genypterus blacodes]|uniref:cell growth regulator with RING finger domain protein 1 isoform X2 n=1 Tax=Genypterus blacodes TaxID=154954 RepID=UPI003F7668A7